MSTDHIRRALETRLAAMSPALATAWENSPYEPEPGTPYQRAFMLYAAPENEVLGCDYRREVGVFQVSLFYPPGTGSAAAQARADAVQEHFPRGLTLTHSGTSVLIPRSPAKAPGFNADGWYVVPVSIPYRAEFF